MDKALYIDKDGRSQLGRVARPGTMWRTLTRLLSGVCVGVVGVGVLAVPSQGRDTAGGDGALTARRAAFKPPKPGPWHFIDPFKDSSGTFKVKAGKRGKPSKVTNVRFDILAQDNGYFCPAPGQTVKIKGRFKLRKAIKYNKGDLSGSPWMLAAKDAPYSTDHPNLVGMRPVETTAKVGSDTRFVQLAMYFVQDRRNKPHSVSVGMRLAPPGSKDLSDGWCIFEGDGKPGKA